MTSKAPEPMDPSARSGGSGEMHVAQPRNCYAMQQLISEVEALFPETPYEVSNRNPRGVAFTVQFVPDEDSDLWHLLGLMGDPAYNEDPRILDVLAESREGIIVEFRNDPRTQDDRMPFGLAGALAVIRETEQVL